MRRAVGISALAVVGGIVGGGAGALLVWWLRGQAPVGEALVNASATLIAAFVGSWSAFKLEDRARARQEQRAQVAAINRAQAALIRQYNALANVQHYIVNPKRNDPLRAINMRPGLGIRLESVHSAGIDDLLFLLETDDRNLLFEILMERDRFENAATAFNRRSQLHETLQPRFFAGGLVEGTLANRQDVIAAIREPVLLALERLTDDVVRMIDLTIDSHLAFSKTFHQAMKARFPKNSIVWFEPTAFPPD